jgi:hypothetical protein
MGLQCSILGHAFESAGVERESEEEGDEVVTTEREIERCRRCGAERVVSESTEVTAVVDGEAVGLEGDGANGGSEAGAAPERDPAPKPEADSEADSEAGDTAAPGSEARADFDAEIGPPPGDDPIGDAVDEMVDRSDDAAELIDADAEEDADATDPDSDVGDATGRPTGGEVIESETTRPAEGPPGDESSEDEPRDTDVEDAEILTDEPDPDRDPGEWPDDLDDGGADTERVVETDAPLEDPDDGEESLSGITVPEGEIVCPECGFRIDAESGYREGDSCPECSGWLETERNQ